MEWASYLILIDATARIPDCLNSSFGGSEYQDMYFQHLFFVATCANLIFLPNPYLYLVSLVFQAQTPSLNKPQK
ncbi:hypothetical protein ACJX0J_030058, partial [Zea mays]